MRRTTPCYPYISLPARDKKAFCDHVINKVSSMFAVEHVLADGCRYGDYEDTEFTFALSFEVPATGNVCMIQQRFRLYLVKSVDLPATAGKCTSKIPYFQGRWKNLHTLYRMKEEARTGVRTPELTPEGDYTPVWGTMRVPLPVRQPPIQVRNTTAAKVFTAVDKDADGTLTRKEWISKFGDDSKFNAYDLDGDGFVSRQEFLRLQMQQETQAMTPEQEPSAQAERSPVQGSGVQRQKNAANRRRRGVEGTNDAEDNLRAKRRSTATPLRKSTRIATQGEDLDEAATPSKRMKR